jgi:hypothetical protein
MQKKNLFAISPQFLFVISEEQTFFFFIVCILMNVNTTQIKKRSFSKHFSQNKEN